MEWIEHHPGLAAWLQAAGSVIAITAAFAVAYLQRHFDLADREQDRRIRAQGLALLILPELLALRGALERYVEREPAGPTSAPPETILRLADQMFVLGKAGGAVLQVLGILNAEAGPPNLPRIASDATVAALLKLRKDRIVMALKSCKKAIDGVHETLKPL